MPSWSAAESLKSTLTATVMVLVVSGDRLIEVETQTITAAIIEKQ